MKYTAFLFVLVSFCARADYWCEKALELHGRQALISAYSFALYAPLNKTLREDLPDPSCREVAERFESAIRGLSKKKLTLYRGTILTRELKSLRMNECFADKGFVSTSADVLQARKFGQKQALMIIDAKSGRDISKYSNITREAEYLLLPETQLMLMKDPYMDQGLKVFEFKEVSPRDCKN